MAAPRILEQRKLRSPDEFKPQDGRRERGIGQCEGVDEWPDVFDPKWVEQVNQRAMDQCGKLKSDPWLLGYFTDNELPWEHEDKAR